MSIKRAIPAILCCALLLSCPVSAIGQTQDLLPDYGPITMDDILSDEVTKIYVSDETSFYPENSILTRAGEYPILTRVEILQSSSSGLKEEDSVVGDYLSIASIALSFGKFVPGTMTVSTILSVVGLIASSDDYVVTRTYTSYIDYVKQGQAKWSDDPDYSTYVMSGKRDYFKHVYSAVKDSSGHWVTSTTDFLETPAKTITGNFYNNSDAWFKEQAYMRIQNGLILDDLPW